MAAPKAPQAARPPDQRSARQRAYDEIVAEAKSGLSRYYAEYPDRLADERSRDAVAWSTRGISRVLRILDRYEISDLPNDAQKGGR